MTKRSIQEIDRLYLEGTAEEVANLDAEFLEYLKEYNTECKVVWDGRRVVETKKETRIGEEIRVGRLEPLEGILRHLDPWREIRGFFIKDVGARVIPFEPYPFQKEIWDWIIDCREKGIAAKGMVLKGRKMGLSTMIASIYYQQTKRNVGTSGLIIAHVQTASDTLFEIYDTFKTRDKYQKVVFEGKILERLPKSLRLHGTRDLQYRDVGGGGIRVYTAKTPDSVRSSTPQRIHASECCFYGDIADDMIAAVQGAIGHEGGLISLYETTGKAGTMFESMWKDEGLSYKKFFFPWFIDPRKTYGFQSGSARVAFERGMSAYEKELREKYNLSLEQVHWWHEALSGFGNRMNKMLQEFPSNADEAFQANSFAVFMPETIRHYENRVVEAVNTGSIKKFGIIGLAVLPAENGELNIFEEPDRNCSYVLGADTAEGKVIGYDGSGMNTDSSAASILKRPGSGETKIKVVATFLGKPRPDRFATILGVIGARYNCAQLNPESNGPGAMVIRQLKRVGRYPNVGRELRIDRSTRPNVLAQQSVIPPGFLTTEKTRGLLFDELIRFVDDKILDIPCQRLIDELRALERDKNGRIEAMSGKHDDLVFATGIALMYVLYNKVVKPSNIWLPVDCSGDGGVFGDGGRKSMNSGVLDIRNKLILEGYPPEIALTTARNIYQANINKIANNAIMGESVI
jgi:hypothetical protein